MAAPKTFNLIKVSEDLHRMVRDVEQRAIAVMLADDDEIDDTYGCLSFSRKFLYEYLEELERLAEVDPPEGWTHLRFT